MWCIGGDVQQMYSDRSLPYRICVGLMPNTKVGPRVSGTVGKTFIQHQSWTSYGPTTLDIFCLVGSHVQPKSR